MNFSSCWGYFSANSLRQTTTPVTIAEPLSSFAHSSLRLSAARRPSTFACAAVTNGCGSIAMAFSSEEM